MQRIATRRGHHDRVRLQKLRLGVRADVEAALAEKAAVEQFEKQQRRREPKERAPRPRRPVAKRSPPKHKRKWPKGKLAGRPFSAGRKFSQQRLVERSR